MRRVLLETPGFNACQRLARSMEKSLRNVIVAAKTAGFVNSFFAIDGLFVSFGLLALLSLTSDKGEGAIGVRF